MYSISCSSASSSDAPPGPPPPLVRALSEVLTRTDWPLLPRTDWLLLPRAGVDPPEWMIITSAPSPPSPGIEPGSIAPPPSGVFPREPRSGDPTPPRSEPPGPSAVPSRPMRGGVRPRGPPPPPPPGDSGVRGGLPPASSPPLKAPVPGRLLPRLLPTTASAGSVPPRPLIGGSADPIRLNEPLARMLMPGPTGMSSRLITPRPPGPPALPAGRTPPAISSSTSPKRRCSTCSSAGLTPAPSSFSTSKGCPPDLRMRYTSATSRTAAGGPGEEASGVGLGPPQRPRACICVMVVHTSSGARSAFHRTLPMDLITACSACSRVFQSGE
ncbi:hypothetical protein TSOC_009752 [Tetrabaena socialis]|uniref:Uncharacterized protein n=1 Tax=Tetrabaena socialis TaxID=47790 RepID=A0A2J7ZV26_9CHLO|nr:hypothetical protein TSOC_009752 [Tetrabaena socialis]|eukprot:PNH04126.1 hypothetical protein TSOC_009752 [Tetrabaena socialis]